MCYNKTYEKDIQNAGFRQGNGQGEQLSYPFRRHHQARHDRRLCGREIFSAADFPNRIDKVVRHPIRKAE